MGALNPTSPAPKRSRRQRPTNDGVARRADSCTPYSSYMRHRVRRNLRVWRDIGASGQVFYVGFGRESPIHFSATTPRLFSSTALPC
jgi:hypothetical protein